MVHVVSNAHLEGVKQILGQSLLESMRSERAQTDAQEARNRPDDEENPNHGAHSFSYRRSLSVGLIELNPIVLSTGQT